MLNKRIIFALYIMILLLTTLSCSPNKPAITDYLNNIKISDETNANNSSIKVLILSSSNEVGARSVLHHLQQSLLVNIELVTQTIEDFSENPISHDLLFLDPYLTVQEIKSLQDKLVYYVSNGGILFLSQDQAKPLPMEFSGIKSFVTIADKELDFSYPKVNQNLRGIQSVWNTFAEIYKRYQGLNPEFDIDFKEGAVVETALPIVIKNGISLLTANAYGQGKVIWANNFLPNEQFITRFDLTPENDQKYFHFGYASANYLFRNELVKYAAKEKYGYSIQKAYGTYGRPSIAWQAHYESLYSFVLQDMIKWAKLLQKHKQIPTYSLIRGSYNGGVWHEALRYN